MAKPTLSQIAADTKPNSMFVTQVETFVLANNTSLSCLYMAASTFG